MREFLKPWLKLFLCYLLILEPGKVGQIKTTTEVDDNTIINNYFESRTEIVGSSVVNEDEIAIPSWIDNKVAYGYLVIPDYYAAKFQTGGTISSTGESYNQSVIDWDNTGLWGGYSSIEELEEKGVDLYCDHNFSNYESNFENPLFPEEADDLYWTKYLPIGSECYTIYRVNCQITIYELVNRYEEYEFANMAFHVDNDATKDIKEKYKNVPSGDLLMVTCDADCTEEDPHVWVTQWKQKKVYSHEEYFLNNFSHLTT